MSDSDEEPPPLEDMSQYLPTKPQPAPIAPVVERNIPVKPAKPPPKDDSSFGQGLKKGFFSSKPAPKPAPKSSPIPPPTEIIDVRPTHPKTSGLVLSEVQQVMQYTEECQQEWLTPDLLQRFAQNPVLARGFMNPRCMAAVEEMRTNPRAATEKYGKDPELMEFLRAFAGLMAEQFGEIGKKKQEEAEMKANTDPEVQALLQDRGVKKVIRRMQKGKPVDLHE